MSNKTGVNRNENVFEQTWQIDNYGIMLSEDNRFRVISWGPKPDYALLKILYCRDKRHSYEAIALRTSFRGLYSIVFMKVVYSVAIHWSCNGYQTLKGNCIYRIAMLNIEIISNFKLFSVSWMNA